MVSALGRNFVEDRQNLLDLPKLAKKRKKYI